MFEVPRRAASLWYRPTGLPYNMPRVVDLSCPHCLRPHVTFTLSNIAPGGAVMSANAKCPGCDATVKFWVVDPPTAGEPDENEHTVILMWPEPPLRAFDEHIHNVSPRFVKIYNQAAQAEARGLDDLVGIGYRKALEFLIKDYLIFQSPEKTDAIKATKQLGTVINNFVTDPNLKEIASRTTWLGNDETHYVREWVDKDIDDLKQLMQLTLYWVSSSLLTQKLIAEMPKPAKQ